MLILARWRGESVLIDGSITVTVLEVNGGQVRLGFDAPREISIVREELPREPSDEAKSA